MERVKRSMVARGRAREKRNRGSTEDSWGSENTLYDTMRMYTSYYTYVQAHRIYSIQNEQ